MQYFVTLSLYRKLVLSLVRFGFLPPHSTINDSTFRTELYCCTLSLWIWSASSHYTWKPKSRVSYFSACDFIYSTSLQV